MKIPVLILVISACAFAQSVTISAPVFSGAGLNDAASGGQFSLLPTNAKYTVTISATGTPDHFTWTKNDGTASAPVAITGGTCLGAGLGTGWQTLTDGVKICWLASTGHTLAAAWTISATARGSLYGTNTIQDGNGARMRTGEDKARETVTPEDFGAKGDGTTNDSAAFQAAVDFLESHGGGKLQCMAKVYVVNFQVGSDIWIAGHGSSIMPSVATARGTVLMSAPGSNLDVIKGKHFSSLTDSAWHVPEDRGDNTLQLTDLTIDGNKSLNSSGYGIRIWGRSPNWNNVIVQRCASGGIWTEFAAGVAPTSSPDLLFYGANTFDHITVTANNGHGWTYRGPGDGSVKHLVSVGNTGWSFYANSYNFTGTANVSGTSVTWVSGDQFGGYGPGSEITIGGVAKTVASVSGTTSLTLTTSAASGSGVAFFSVSYLGATDQLSDSNCFVEGLGCYYFGPHGSAPAVMNNVIASDSPTGIEIDPDNASVKMSNMSVNGNTNYGLKMAGGFNEFHGELSHNGTALTLTSLLSSTIVAYGSGNTVAINDVSEVAANNITALFSVSAGNTCVSGTLGSESTLNITCFDGVNPNTVYLQTPTLYEISSGQNIFSVRNQTNNLYKTRIITDNGGNATVNSNFPHQTVWTASQSYPLLGQQLQDPAGHIQKVTTIGVSGAAFPNPWNDSGGTTTDGTVVWTDQGELANAFICNLGCTVNIGSQPTGSRGVFSFNSQGVMVNSGASGIFSRLYADQSLVSSTAVFGMRQHGDLHPIYPGESWLYASGDIWLNPGGARLFRFTDAGGGGVLSITGSMNASNLAGGGTRLTCTDNSGVLFATGCVAATAITQLTGDVTATGPGIVASALSTTGVTAGTYGDSTHTPQITVDAKGRLSIVTNVAIGGGATVTDTFVTGCSLSNGTATACTNAGCTTTTTVVTTVSIGCSTSSAAYTNGLHQ